MQSAEQKNILKSLSSQAEECCRAKEPPRVESGLLTQGWVWLSLLPSISIAQKLMLIEKFEGITNLVAAGGEEYIQHDIGKQSVLDLLLSNKYREKAHTIIEHSAKEGIEILHPNAPDYPRLLKFITDMPLAIYKLGKGKPCRSIAVVGSRRATGYGISVAEHLAAEIAAAGFGVVSGLARGIDTAAHTGALRVNGDTTAVLANGLGIIYPPENRKLAERIAASGCLLSEYAPGTPPAPYRFPVRNRIISGIAEAVLVVEAGEKSGSLITVQCALDQGREVFAVPGNVTSPSSRGCNNLIREGAGLVQGAIDILESLAPNPLVRATPEGFANRGTSLDSQWPLEFFEVGSAGIPTAAKRENGATEADEKRHSQLLVMAVLRREALSVDQLCQKTKLSPSDLQQILLKLELDCVARLGLDGLVRIVPGTAMR